MKWGFFTPQHILTLILAAAMITGLYYILKNKSHKIQTAVLFLLSLSGIAAIIYNLVTWGSPLEYLPLHLCSINALILPVAVLTRNKTLGNLLHIVLTIVSAPMMASGSWILSLFLWACLLMASLKKLKI